MEKKDVYNEEFNYVYQKYLKGMHNVTDFKEVKNRPCKRCLVELKGKKYEFYKYSFDEILLIPAKVELLSGDFDNIIRYNSYEEAGFSFSIINKKDGIITEKKYNYSSFYEDGHVKAQYVYKEINDENNLLYQNFLNSKKPTEEFIQRGMIKNIEMNQGVFASTKLSHGDKRIYVSPLVNSFISKEMFNDYSNTSKYKYIDNDKCLLENCEEKATQKMYNEKRKIKKKNE